MTSTAVKPRSAYPATVDELLPRAVALAEQIGEMPSIRRLTTELRIGAPKARELMARLADSQARPTGPAHTVAPGATPDTVSDAEPRPALVAPDASGELDADMPGDKAVPNTSISIDQKSQVVVAADAPADPTPRPVRWWPVLLLALPAFVAIWSGWVGLGALTGFGVVRPLPGIADAFAINTAITLPVGMEAYAAYALRAWLAVNAPVRARRFAKWSAIGSLTLGALGQVTYHLMTAAGMTAAPWPVTTLVSCLPVAVLGMGAALAHLLHVPSSTSVTQ